MIRIRIGIIDAGVMGVDVPQVLTHAQDDVVLTEFPDDSLTRTKGRRYQNRRLNRLSPFSKKSYKTPNERISQITFTTEYQQLHDVDFDLRDILHC